MARDILDDELLALADGDDSSPEQSRSPSPRKRSSSPTNYVKSSSPAPQPRKSAAKPARKPRARKTYSDDEDDSVSERSRSPSLSASDSEDDVPDERSLYPYERLYKDARDKAELDAKPELEREEILAKRSEVVERAEMDAQLRRMMKARNRREAKEESKKRKASAADLDDNQRKSTRQRTKVGGGKAGEQSSAIANYKKQREEKAMRAERKKERAAQGRSPTPVDDYSDVDAEGESDRDYDRYERKEARKKSPSPAPNDPPADLHDVQRVRVGRDNFAQVCGTPGFADTITGCYARVCLGPGRSGQNDYRLCTIKGIETGRPYAMQGVNGKAFLTDKYILAAHGKSVRTWSFIECSNSRFTDDEWRRYRLTMANEDGKMPTKGQIESKLRQIDRLIKHKFTDAEISQKLKDQTALVDTVNRTAERRDLKRQLLEAEDAEDEQKIRDLEDRLVNLVPLKLALGTTMAGIAGAYKPEPARRIDAVSQQDRASPAPTTKSTSSPAPKHGKVYKKAIRPAQDPSRLAVSQSNGGVTDDELFGASGSDISRAATPVNGHRTEPSLRNALAAKSMSSAAEGISRSSTPLSLRTGNDAKKGIPVIKKSKRDDELLRDVDLGIDIEI